jgi:hypothetical protein
MPTHHPNLLPSIGQGLGLLSGSLPLSLVNLHLEWRITCIDSRDWYLNEKKLKLEGGLPRWVSCFYFNSHLLSWIQTTGQNIVLDPDKLSGSRHITNLGHFDIWNSSPTHASPIISMLVKYLAMPRLRNTLITSPISHSMTWPLENPFQLPQHAYLVKKWNSSQIIKINSQGRYWQSNETIHLRRVSESLLCWRRCNWWRRWVNQTTMRE